jgi:hypothetical protein
MKSPIITEKFIRIAEINGACDEALEWLRERPKTVMGLVRFNHDWSYWALFHVAPKRYARQFQRYCDTLYYYADDEVFNRAYSKGIRVSLEAWITEAK